MDKPRWYVSWALGGFAGIVAVNLHLPWWGQSLLGFGVATVACGIEHYRSTLQNRKETSSCLS